MALSWPPLEKSRASNGLANNALRPQQGQGARAEVEVAEEPVMLKLGVCEAAAAGVVAVGGCDCRGGMEGAAAAAAAAVDDGGSSGGGATGGGDGKTQAVSVARVLALPEAILSEVLGELLRSAAAAAACVLKL